MEPLEDDGDGDGDDNDGEDGDFDDGDMIIIFLLHNMWSHKGDDVKLNIDTIHI